MSLRAAHFGRCERMSMPEPAQGATTHELARQRVPNDLLGKTGAVDQRFNIDADSLPAALSTGERLTTFFQERVINVPGVVGDGNIGLLAVQVARLFSPAIIMLVGSRNERLEMARHLGATHIINIRQSDPEPLIQSLTGGHGADFVFECGTRPEGVETSIRLARRGGTVVLEGIAGSGARLSLESDIFVLKHLSVFDIFGASSAAWTYAVQVFRSGLLNLAPLITHRFALTDYRAALDAVVGRQSKTLKVLLIHDWDSEGVE